MRKPILALLTVLFVLVMAVGGCKDEKPAAPNINEPESENARSDSQQDSLEVVSTNPKTPAVLLLGKKLRVKIRYNLASAEKARIWARPYTKGRRTSSYKAHGSPLHDAGNSEIESYFYFDIQTKVDEVRVIMVSPDSKEPIATASLAVDVEWKGEKQDSLEILSIMPQTPVVLPLGEKLRVKVRYHLVSAEKAHIWARAYTEGKHTGSSRSHGSYWHEAGDGETEGWFYFDEQKKVDEVRVKMVSPDFREPIATASMAVDAEWK